MRYGVRRWVGIRSLIAIASGCMMLGSLAALPTATSFAADDDTLAVYGDDDIEEEGYKPIDQVAKTSVATSNLSDEITSTLLDDLQGELFGLGFNYLLELAFPQPNYSAELSQIESSLNAGFAQTNAELTAIQSSINTLSQQVTNNVAVSSQGTCQTLTAQADGYVANIQKAYANYVDASSPSWINANVSGQSGVNVLSIYGQQVFGTGSGAPPFLSGLNSVAIDTQNLATLLNSSASGQASGGLIATCANAVAASLATNSAPAGVPAKLGTMENSYFTAMQEITGYYTSWVNIGSAMSVQGGVYASMLVSATPPQNYQQAQGFCAGAITGASSNPPMLLNCSGVRAFAANVDSAVDQAWASTGASWGQTTGGVIQTALRVNPATGYFAGGSTPWLSNLATYGQVKAGQSNSSPALTGNITVPANDPRGVNLAGSSIGSQAGLQKSTWGGLSFLPAASAQWDALLGLESSPNFYQNAMVSSSFNYCLPNSSNQVVSCVDPQGQLFNRIASTGLRNGASAVGPGLIIYTGETTNWNPAQSSWPAAMAQYKSAAFPQNVPPAQVASFLDTSALMVSGRSAVINNPDSVDGNLTVADMYPFASNTNGIGTTIQTAVTTIFELNQSATSGVTESTGVQCAQSDYPNGVTGQTLLQFLGGSQTQFAVGGGSSTTNLLVGNGSTARLYCQNNGWEPPSGTSGVPVLSTPDQSFYSAPQLYVAYAPDSEGLFGMGMFLCSVAAAQNNGVAVRGDTCPNNPYQITAPNGGNQPGWMVSAGQGASVSPDVAYGWPVVNTASPSCKPSSVTQGSQQNVGAPSVCANYLNPFLSGAFGVDFGPLTATVAPTTGTAGNASVTIAVSNISSNSQTANFGAVMTGLKSSRSSAISPSTTTKVTTSTTVGGASQSLKCKVTKKAVACPSVQFGPGTTLVTIPVNGQRGNVDVLLDGISGPVQTGVYATADGTVVPGPTAQTLPPAAVTGVQAALSNSNDVTVSWLVPTSASPISSYQISYREPNGGSGSVTVPASQVRLSQQGSGNAAQIASYTTELPESGFWTISVAATNANGTGLAGSTSLLLGAGPPPMPQNLKARELPNGRVLLSWSPISASPPLDSYAITSTSPSGQATSLNVVAMSTHITAPLTATGVWTFSVVAKNASGTSAPASVRINVVGSVPGMVQALSTSVSGSGSVDTSWLSPLESVPPPSSYSVTLYAPSSVGSKAVASVTVPSSDLTSTVSVPALYQLGKNSPTGAWTIVVQATNATGVGVAARSTLYVTPALVVSLGRDVSFVQFIDGVPKDLYEIERETCATQLARGSFSTGICRDGVFTRI